MMAQTAAATFVYPYDAAAKTSVRRAAVLQQPCEQTMNCSSEVPVNLCVMHLSRSDIAHSLLAEKKKRSPKLAARDSLLTAVWCWRYLVGMLVQGEKLMNDLDDHGLFTTVLYMFACYLKPQSSS